MTIVYFYDETGFITGTNTSNWPEGHEYLKQPNIVVLPDAIKATMQTEHADGKVENEETIVKGGGWSFVMENGVPKKEGDNYVMSPPEVFIPPPTKDDYIFSGLVKAGFINPTEVPSHIINQINWSLGSAASPIIEGTELITKPIRSVKKE